MTWVKCLFLSYAKKKFVNLSARHCFKLNELTFDRNTQSNWTKKIANRTHSYVLSFEFFPLYSAKGNNAKQMALNFQLLLFVCFFEVAKKRKCGRSLKNLRDNIIAQTSDLKSIHRQVNINHLSLVHLRFCHFAYCDCCDLKLAQKFVALEHLAPKLKSTRRFKPLIRLCHFNVSNRRKKVIFFLETYRCL